MKTHDWKFGYICVKCGMYRRDYLMTKKECNIKPKIIQENNPDDLLFLEYLFL